MKTWEIERLFNEDIREKKKVGRGSFSKVGKGGERARVRGGLKTPYDFMKTKERKKLNSEVRISNMYETIIPIDEFRLKDKETQKNMLTRWRDLYDNSHIKEGLGIHNTLLYKLVDELNLPKKPRGGANHTKETKDNKKRTATVKTKDVSPVTLLDMIPEEKRVVEKEDFKQTIITRGLHLEYNGKYDVDSLSKLFTKLQLLIDGDSNKYNIKLSLTEISEDDI